MSITVTEHPLSENAVFGIYSDLGESNLSDEQFEELWSQKPDERGKVFVYGKEHDVPRWCKSYGQSYFFSGREHIADPLDSIIVSEKKFLKKCIKRINKQNGTNYNQCLINWYGNNQHCIGFHSDDEKMFVPGSSVACFNYCKLPRDIVLKKKEGKKQVTVLKHSMAHNTGYSMLGSNFQSAYTHGVPKRVSKDDRDERRISLTFREFQESPELKI
jgi:hypothetical protein